LPPTAHEAEKLFAGEAEAVPARRRPEGEPTAD
jgi:hypothetical protein